VNGPTGWLRGPEVGINLLAERILLAFLVIYGKMQVPIKPMLQMLLALIM
jgi:hypothetical protein